MRIVDPAGEPSLCRFGCYWECEHRVAAEGDGLRASVASVAASTPMPVHDDSGRELRRCRDCGGMFYGLMDHAREHERLRQLGLLPPPLAPEFSV
jgi:hypothetical protein